MYMGVLCVCTSAHHKRAFDPSGLVRDGCEPPRTWMLIIKLRILPKQPLLLLAKSPLQPQVRVSSISTQKGLFKTLKKKPFIKFHQSIGLRLVPLSQDFVILLKPL